jgi:glycerophosphoryl diester phosphodiesterase
MTSWGVRRRLADIASYADGIGPHQRRVGPALVDAAHAAGLWVHPYTVNDAPTMQRLLGLGVDGIFSDHADVLREVIASRPQGEAV